MDYDKNNMGRENSIQLWFKELLSLEDRNFIKITPFCYLSLLQNSIYNVIHPIYSVVD